MGERGRQEAAGAQPEVREHGTGERRGQDVADDQGTSPAFVEASCSIAPLLAAVVMVGRMCQAPKRRDDQSTDRQMEVCRRNRASSRPRNANSSSTTVPSGVLIAIS